MHRGGAALPRCGTPRSRIVIRLILGRLPFRCNPAGLAGRRDPRFGDVQTSPATSRYLLQ
jgi:hypothetical protein